MSEDEVLKFAGNEYFTPTTRTLLISAIKSLEGVQKSEDHLVWTEDVATILTDAHDTVVRKFTIVSSEIVVAGTISSRS